MKTCPKSGVNLETIMSNFDGVIEEGSELKLKSMDCYGEYTAWNFFGIVWYDGEQFCCEVMQYCSHVNTVYANSLQEIMNKCCEYYGSK